MKTKFIAAILLLATIITTAALIAQVDIPIDPVTVTQPVTLTQNVTISSVAVQTITFDVLNERILFRIASGVGGNTTLTIAGSEYAAIRSTFLAPFAAQIAPTLRARLAGPTPTPGE